MVKVMKKRLTKKEMRFLELRAFGISGKEARRISGLKYEIIGIVKTQRKRRKRKIVALTRRRKKRR